MKVLIAEFHQESNSFSPVMCDMEMFRNTYFLEGEEIVSEMSNTATEMSGFMRALIEADADMIPSVAAHSVSSGPVTNEVYDYIMNRVERDLQELGAVDGVLLSFHGAMLLEPDQDASGLFLERLRKIVGDQVVIGCSLDLHANVTQKMVENANILVGYHTYPHIDLFETGYKAANLLIQTMQGNIHPVTAFVKIPMIVNGPKCQTSHGPMKIIQDRVSAIMAKEGILSANVFQMQPWLNVPEAGCSALVISNDQQGLAEQSALSLATEFWESRKHFVVELTPLEEAVEAAISAAEGPVILADSADGTGSGSPGDSTAILHELLRRETDIRVYLTVVDPESVQRAIDLGVGVMGNFKIGGKIDTFHHTPVHMQAMVKVISDGTFTFKGPQFTGMEHHMGRTAVLQIRNIFVVVMEQSAFNWDPALYRSLGLEPKEAKAVIVKSPTAFRANYEPMASAIYSVDAPGVSSANLRNMAFTQLPSPMYPFDTSFTFQPNARICDR